ncbi:MAG TPA: hypothetical protein VEJ88_09015 [Dissulfurispiraceae bacterium]|nr:hypothetical protein [Dissulfurispiraceae bacterium]
MEEKTPVWTEKRMSPRVHASGNLTFKTYWGSDPGSSEFLKTSYVPAELLDVSMDGMRIKTSTPLEEKNLLEFSKDYHMTRIALVRWVKKIDSWYHAGLMYIHH